MRFIGTLEMFIYLFIFVGIYFISSINKINNLTKHLKKYRLVTTTLMVFHMEWERNDDAVIQGAAIVFIFMDSPIQYFYVLEFEVCISYSIHTIDLGRV